MLGHLASILCHGVFERFPRTRVMLMEGGLVPFVGLLWRLDTAWRGCRSEVPYCVRPPSDYVRDHVAWTTQPLEEPPEDRLLAPAIEGLQPARTLCFSSDYPHWDFDDPRQTLLRLPAEYREDVAHANALRFFAL
jgi:predicted TIM-barrel fold metal-dependent hydrolase